jgi:hypothetical protein
VREAEHRVRVAARGAEGQYQRLEAGEPLGEEDRRELLEVARQAIGEYRGNA